MTKFLDRYEAGKILAEYLTIYKHKPNVIVLALPRGGVPVAYEVAKYLSVPLDIFIVRKLGVPGHDELAMGAIAGDTIVFNEDIINHLHISKDNIDQVIQSEQNELRRRELVYRGNRPFPVLSHKTIILVDDGVATGATMRAAVKALQQYHPENIVIAIPVTEVSIYHEMEKWGYKIICPLIKQNFYAVGAWYEHFEQTTDEEVFNLLSSA